jgi:DNA-directed RNA polymerase specialized sigma subunit
MTHDHVTKLLKDYRCYKHALISLSAYKVQYESKLPLVISERVRGTNTWDADRYSRLISAIDGAIQDVLSDDQRAVISRKYLDRNQSTLAEIADALHKDVSTVSRWHKEAIRRISLAIMPVNDDYVELTSFGHMFDKDGKWTNQPA